LKKRFRNGWPPGDRRWGGSPNPKGEKKEKEGCYGKRGQKAEKKNLQAQTPQTSKEDPSSKKKAQVKLTGKAKPKSGRNLSFWRGRGEVNPLLQLFPDFEKRQFLRGDLDFCARAGVPTLIGLVGAHGEIAEPADFDSLAFGQSLNHRGKDRVHNGFGVLLSERIRFFHELLDQLKLGHAPLLLA
jgi:hypothetical protein